MSLAQYRSPTGAMIIGLARVADVTTFVAGFRPDGTPVLEAEHQVDWSSLQDKLRHGRLLFRDEAGAAWPFDQLTRVDSEAPLD